MRRSAQGLHAEKSFKLVDAKGKEKEEATALFETGWFKDLIGYILDSRYWGHSLIQLGDVISVDGKMRYKDVELVPRKHVIPEYGAIIREQGDEWKMVLITGKALCPIGLLKPENRKTSDYT